MHNHHVYWENLLCKWPSSIAMFVSHCLEGTSIKPQNRDVFFFNAEDIDRQFLSQHNSRALSQVMGSRAKHRVHLVAFTRHLFDSKGLRPSTTVSQNFMKDTHLNSSWIVCQRR